MGRLWEVSILHAWEAGWTSPGLFAAEAARYLDGKLVVNFSYFSVGASSCLRSFRSQMNRKQELAPCMVKLEHLFFEN